MAHAFESTNRGMKEMDGLVAQMRDVLSKSEAQEVKQQEINTDLTFKINHQKRELVETRKDLTENIKEKASKEVIERIENKIEEFKDVKSQMQVITETMQDLF